MERTGHVVNHNMVNWQEIMTGDFELRKTAYTLDVRNWMTLAEVGEEDCPMLERPALNKIQI